MADFIAQILDPSPRNRFLESFIPLAEEVARMGAINSLSQVLLKLTSPGVPDVYQGNEIWDFSLVDPDNRRPVDYVERKKMLDALKGADPGELLEQLERRPNQAFPDASSAHFSPREPGTISRWQLSAARPDR